MLAYYLEWHMRQALAPMLFSLGPARGHRVVAFPGKLLCFDPRAIELVPRVRPALRGGIERKMQRREAARSKARTSGASTMSSRPVTSRSFFDLGGV
jgi:hypothetical protein